MTGKAVRTRTDEGHSRAPEGTAALGPDGADAEGAAKNHGRLHGPTRPRHAGPLPPIGTLLNGVLCPSVIVASLAACTIAFNESFSEHYLLLGILVFLISSRVLNDIDLFLPWRPIQLMQATRSILIGWAVIVGGLLFLGYATRLGNQFDYQVIVTWFAVTPILLLGSVKIARVAVRFANRTETVLRSAVIVGVSDASKRLAAKLSEDLYLGQRMQGFFDDRQALRIGELGHGGLLGHIAEVAAYVRRNNVHYVYVSLPMVAQGRVVDLIQQLRDTTASVYFLPDLFVFDVVQARFDDLGGIPVVAICETPLNGVNAMLKRATDLVFAGAILLLTAPLLLLIAAGVKLSSPGPVLFRQRRYGVDGTEIIVRKFRSMTVWEDGDRIIQAKWRDARVTRFGALLRRTSLDELPQFLDVLQGSMSIVGPRPHAVAHSEQYRKLIPGYMVRHKVKPGITGWAQVNGSRGETETLEKMQRRVEFDLDYMKNWSLSLDLWIILKTVPVILKGRHAY